MIIGRKHIISTLTESVGFGGLQRTFSSVNPSCDDEQGCVYG